ncbi:Pentatricopeptide repeat-containing protein [Durusdinium trenchii]|uniref:Chloroplastic n=1 Tax=Durusdinium trenchii TaxID=1381693 RepID=A0ABP0IE21_9DINO
MFLFNAAVMGFGNSAWMHLVLEQFDAMVMNVANSYRLQEECDVLSLVLAQYEAPITLSEFKAVMLASLRSLVPKDWDSSHEVAWNWFWENVERMLQALMGKPALQQASLERFIMSLDEESLTYLRREIYKRFFTVAPAGQDHFKQSTTRLYWIADKVIEMTSEMYRDPKKLVEDISALGLRHVGYGIPTEFFAPFVSSAVEAVKSVNPEEIAQEAFRWSLTLVSKILVRTILEGSTIVMKAINTNDAKQLRKAISVAPRGKRAAELLNITVGTQSISPLYWAIESGSLNTAKAMLEDLLVIRADRDQYYCGCDQLFDRHPEIIHKLNSDAPNLLRTLLDGLVWRSRLIISGQRRVNYYVKHLVQDADGGFNKGLEWIVEGQDPKIICHDVVVLFADMLWAGLAGHIFLLGRCYFLFTLAVFITGQSILPQLHDDPSKQTDAERIAIFACRMIIYVFSMGQLFVNQVRCLIGDCRSGHIIRVLKFIPFPEYLTSMMQVGNLALMICLLVLCTQDPIFHCMGKEGPLFTQQCSGYNIEVYSTLSMAACHWAVG